MGGSVRGSPRARRVRIALGVLGAFSLPVARAAPPAEFHTVYAPPVADEYRIYYEELSREHFLESVAEELNHVLVLPHPIRLAIAECGHSTTAWVAASRTVTVCYEFLDAVLVIAGDSAGSQARAEQLFSGAVTFALLAEVGHALVEEYRLPVPGDALRAGDEFAAITLASAERNGDPSAAAAVEFFDAALRKPDSGFEYLETHRFDRDRLETVACILYGNAPADHAASLEHGIVSKSRAPHCAEAVVAVASTWDRYLKSHTRQPAPVAPAPAPHP